jgi:glyoxylase-like metal-dependent hydrolase (beta-lactamase superfamily II)
MKKKSVCLTAFALATSLLSAKAADWHAPQEPFPVYGSTYYVGTGGISALLIIAHTRAVRDGETIRLGPLAVTAHFTPGHTQGGTSWTWDAEEGGRTVLGDAAFIDADACRNHAIKAGAFLAQTLAAEAAPGRAEQAP